MSEDNIIKNKPEQLLNSIFDSVRDGIVIVDKTGKVVRVSKSAIDISGYGADEILNKRLAVMKMFSPASILTMAANLIKQIKGEYVKPFEVEAHKKNGDILWTGLSGNALRREGKIIGAIGILRDVSERVDAFNKIKKKNEELEEVNKKAVNRELKIIELKNRIKELEEKLKKK